MDLKARIIRGLLCLPLSIPFWYAMFRLGRWLMARVRERGSHPFDQDHPGVGPGWLAALLAYIAVTILCFSPVLARLSSALLGPAEDNMQSLWNLWWGHQCFTSNPAGLFYTRVICYPEGVSLLYHALSYYNQLVSQLLYSYAGPVLTYNVLILHTFVLAGLGAYLLALYLLRNRWLALLAGFLFAFNPSHMAHALHHLNIASIQFVPFFVLYFIRCIRERSRRLLWLAALFLLLNTLCDWTYFFFAGYFMLGAYAYLAIRNRRIWLPQIAAKIAVLTGLTLTVLSPLLFRLLSTGLSSAQIIKSGHDSFVIDLLALGTPPDFHVLGRLGFFAAVRDRFDGNAWEAVGYFGLAALVLVALTRREILKSSAHYCLAILGAMVLSMGGTLHLCGLSNFIMLPYAILGQFPVLSAVRCPSRHVVYAYLFLALLLPKALQFLRQARWLGRAAGYLTVLAAGLLVVDLAPVRVPVTPVDLPPSYQVILQHREPGAILDLPTSRVDDNPYMMYQTLHNRPIVGGTVSRKLHPTLIDSLSRQDLAAQKRQLREAGVRFVVLHKEYFRPEEPIDTSAYLQVYDCIYVDSNDLVMKVY